MLTSLYAAFNQQAILTPDLPCLIEQAHCLTYAEVLARINRYAQTLYTLGINAGDVVAIYAEKSIDSVVSFLALSKLGATTLTMDTAFPDNMLEYLVNDAKVVAVFHQHHWPLKVPAKAYSFNQLNLEPKQVSSGQHEAQPHWIVYSSGTTGNPKGIIFNEQAILTSFYNRYQFSDYTQDDQVACSIYFYWEVFRPLLKGASVHIINEKTLLDIDDYFNYLFTNKITETLWTPSFADIVLNDISLGNSDNLAGLKRVWLNGEVVTKHLVEKAQRVIPHVDLLNLYSLSETYDVCAKKITASDISQQGFASIGKPLSNVSWEVLDENKESCAVGVQGELYVCSDSLALGYLNLVEVTKQSFINYQGKRYFKTKDIAIKTLDNQVYILGRNDHVVKLRGYNVSLIAIEDVIKRLLPVNQCVVSVRGDSTANQQLIATLEIDSVAQFSKQYSIDLLSNKSATINELLADYLPHYCIPAMYVCIDKLGRSQYSAKLERKQSSLPTHNSAAANIANAWYQVLDIPRQTLGFNSDFFYLGGSSLQLIQLAKKLSESFNVAISTSDLFQASTLAQQIELISKGSIDHQDIYPTIVDDINAIPLDTTIEDTSSQAQQIISGVNAKKIFITGATGFLAAHCLSQLITLTQAHFYCLVRASNDDEGRARLLASFNKYNLDTSQLNQRVTVVCGDLEKPKLGLSDTKYNELAVDVELIFHAAAKVNLLLSYHQLKPSIVEGTKSLLKLAVTQRKKAFVLISSDAVLAQGEQTSSEFLSQDSVKQLSYGYAQAKWVQEQLLQRVYQQSDLPFHLFRLGNLSPSLITAGANEFDANGMVCQYIKQYGVVVENLSLELTPVNLIADYIVNKINQGVGQQIETLSHINNIDAAAIAKHYFAKIISQDKWIEHVNQHSLAIAELWHSQHAFSQYNKVTINNKPFLKMNEEQIKKSLALMASEKKLEQVI